MANDLTQDEFDKAEAYLVGVAMSKLGISKKAATLRVKAIIKSGILTKFGLPDEVPFQAAIDAAMQIPQLGESEED